MMQAIDRHSAAATGGPPALPAWAGASELQTGRSGRLATAPVVPAAVRATLAAIAAAGWTTPAGDVLAESGAHLWEAAGIRRSTFFAHLARLEAAGMVRRVRLQSAGRDGRAVIYQIVAHPEQDLLPATLGRVSRPTIPPSGPDVGRYDQPTPPPREPRVNEVLSSVQNLDSVQDSVQNLDSVQPAPDLVSGISGRCAQHQKDQSGGRTGPPRAAPAQRPTRPRLHDVQPDDLVDFGRLMELYEQAVRKGLLRRSDEHLELLVACALHAVQRAEHPPRMFAQLIRQRTWPLSETVRDQAHNWIRRELYDDPAPIAPPPAEPLSADGRVARRVLAFADRPRLVGQDPLEVARRYLPSLVQGWDAQRWYQAVAEVRRAEGEA